MKTVQAASLVSIFILSACGMDMSMPVELPLPTVVFASKQELKDETVVPSSYIVAFRGQTIGYNHLTMPSYREEWSLHSSYLIASYAYDYRVQKIRYIHAIDLASPQKNSGDGHFQLIPGLRKTIIDQDSPAEPLVLSEVTFASPEEAHTVLAEWEAMGEIWFAEPNYQTRLTQDDEETPTTGGSGVFAQYKTTYGVSTPWWHTSIKLLEAFDAADAASDSPQTPVIAVLDSGLDVEHPAFVDRVFQNTSVGIAGCSGDKNGCDTTSPKKGELGVGNVNPFGWNGTECAKEDIKNCQHGTHVAGIIAAKFQSLNDFSYGGVCPVCKVMPIKIISGTTGKGAAKDSAIINGLVYLSRFTTKSSQSALVRVANSSFGKYSRSRAVALMVSILAKNNNLLVVGAASNEDSMLRAYPAALADALAVSAVDNMDRKASYSNFGAWVDVSAPGGDSTNTGGFPDSKLFVSSVPRGSENGTDYAGKQGTSMAAPVVAGVAGLVLSVDPGRNFRALRKSIIESADPRIYDREGATSFNQNYYVDIGVEVKRPLLGSGVVDAALAITNNDRTGLLVSGIDRVNSGCATVGLTSKASSLLLFLIPFFVWFHQFLRQKNL